MALLEHLALFFERGGWVLWAILVASTAMWVILLERVWFLRFRARAQAERLVAQWRVRQPAAGFAREVVREALTERYAQSVLRRFGLLTALAGVLPMLGLLGTVSGMIQTFEVMTLYGGGNARGMAAGISEALYTTMAGLLTGLVGVYLASHLDSWAQGRLRDFNHRLVETRA